MDIIIMSICISLIFFLSNDLVMWPYNETKLIMLHLTALLKFIPVKEIDCELDDG